MFDLNREPAKPGGKNFGTKTKTSIEFRVRRPER